MSIPPKMELILAAPTSFSQFLFTIFPSWSLRVGTSANCVLGWNSKGYTCHSTELCKELKFHRPTVWNEASAVVCDLRDRWANIRLLTDMIGSRPLMRIAKDPFPVIKSLVSEKRQLLLDISTLRSVRIIRIDRKAGNWLADCCVPRYLRKHLWHNHRSQASISLQPPR